MSDLPQHLETHSHPAPNALAISSASSGTTQTIDTRQAQALRAIHPDRLNEFHHDMLHKFDNRKNQNQNQQQHQHQPQSQTHFRSPPQPETAPEPSAGIGAPTVVTTSSMTSEGTLPSILNAERLSRLGPTARQHCLDLMRRTDREAGWTGGFLELVKQQQEFEVQQYQQQHQQQQQQQRQPHPQEGGPSNTGARATPFAQAEEHTQEEVHTAIDDEENSSIALGIELPPDVQKQIRLLIWQQHAHCVQALEIEMKLKEVWWHHAGRFLTSEGQVTVGANGVDGEVDVETKI